MLKSHWVLPPPSTLCYFKSACWPHRLAARTWPSQGQNTGSIPVGAMAQLILHRMLEPQAAVHAQGLERAKERDDKTFENYCTVRPDLCGGAERSAFLPRLCALRDPNRQAGV